MRTLQRSKHDIELRTWGAMLYWIAFIVLLAEIGIYLHALGHRHPSRPVPFHGDCALVLSPQLVDLDRTRGTTNVVHLGRLSCGMPFGDRRGVSVGHAGAALG